MLRILLVGVVLTTLCVPGRCAVTKRTDKCIEVEKSKSKSIKDDKDIKNLMSMIQETCTSDNTRITAKQLEKETDDILEMCDQSPAPMVYDSFATVYDGSLTLIAHYEQRICRNMEDAFEYFYTYNGSENAINHHV